MHGGAFGAHRVSLITHGMNATGVDPAIVKIEERADRDGVVNRLVSVADLVEGLDIGGLDGGRVAIHLLDEAHKRFL